MVLPAPTEIDARMQESQAQVTLDQVVAFLQDAPPELLDYLFEMMSQQGDSAPADPSVAQAMGAISPIDPMMR